MPNIAEIVDHEKLFREIVDSGITPVIINDLPCTTESDKEKIKELTLTQLTSDTLSIIPTCGGTCNSTRGQYALGRICPICKNEVRSTIGGSARSILWMRAPNGIDKLINIVVWNMLSSYFTKSNYNAIAWLTDSAYAPNNREPIEIEKLRARGHDRDLNYFVRNFDDIFEDLMEIFEEKRAKPFSDLRDFIASVRDIMFTKYLPLPSKNLFITDKTILGIWMESAIQEALDTIYHFVSIDLDFYDKNPKVIANRTARVLARQGVFYHKYIATNLQPKPGHYRRCILGSRDIFSGRGVIISETGDHDCNEVGIPWRIAVPMYQHHLIGKLMRHGYSQNGALGYVMSHVAVYDKLLHRFLDEVFSEFAGGKGPVFILHRNPTLQQGSMQTFYGYLKTDPHDPTISMSILDVTAPNADFDGDQLNLKYAVDKKMADFWVVFKPEYNVFLLDNPMEVSGNLALTKPIIMTAGAWMDDPNEQ